MREKLAARTSPSPSPSPWQPREGGTDALPSAEALARVRRLACSGLSARVAHIHTWEPADEAEAAEVRRIAPERRDFVAASLCERVRESGEALAVSDLR